MTHHLALESLGVGELLSADRVIFEIVLNTLIRIELGRVWWKKEQPEAVLDRFGKLPHSGNLVGRVTVDDQEDWAIGVVNEPFDEFDEHKGSDTPLRHHEPEEFGREMVSDA